MLGIHIHIPPFLINLPSVLIVYILLFPSLQILRIGTYTISMQNKISISKFLKEIGSTIRELRRANGKTQERLAEDLGVHPSYIGQLERGQREPSLHTVKKLSMTFNVPLSEILNERHGQSDEDWKKKCIKVIDKCNEPQLEAIYQLIRTFLFRS